MRKKLELKSGMMLKEREAAALMGVSYASLRQQRWRGGVPHIKRGRSIRYSSKQIQDLIAAHTVEAKN